jgi:hypothetical protein
VTVQSAKGGKVKMDAPDAVESILSVGYLNTMAIRFDGKGNPIEAIRAARKKLAESLGQIDDEELEEMLNKLEEEADAEASTAQNSDGADGSDDAKENGDAGENQRMDDADADKSKLALADENGEEEEKKDA